MLSFCSALGLISYVLRGFQIRWNSFAALFEPVGAAAGFGIATLLRMDDASRVRCMFHTEIIARLLVRAQALLFLAIDEAPLWHSCLVVDILNSVCCHAW